LHLDQEECSALSENQMIEALQHTTQSCTTACQHHIVIMYLLDATHATNG
jgi:hypothetical protein